MMNSMKNLMLGAASALDLFATLDLRRQNSKQIPPEEADYIAMLNDWENVGKDMRYAIGQVAGRK